MAEKRARKCNFTNIEIKTLLEEVAVEAHWLSAKNNAKITNKKKELKWKEIASKVSSCGVCERSWTEVKEKYKKMRNDVLNRQREMKKTGGGNPPPQVPYEEIILQLIGESSDLIMGIPDVDLPEEENDWTLLKKGEAKMCEPKEYASQCSSSSTSSYHDGHVTATAAQTLASGDSIVLVTMPEGQVVENVDSTNLFYAEDTVAQAVLSTPHRAMSTSQLKEDLSAIKRKRSRESAHATHADADFWQPYLQSEIFKNERQGQLHEIKRTVLLSELEKNEKSCKMLEAQTEYYRSRAAYFKTLELKARMEMS